MEDHKEPPVAVAPVASMARPDIFAEIDKEALEPVEISDELIDEYNHTSLAVVILDGWDVLLLEEEGDESEEEKDEAPPEPAPPQEWSCGACTMANPMGLDVC